MISSYLMVSTRESKKMVSFLTKDCYRPAKISGKNALGEKKTVRFLQDACDAQFLVYCGSYLHIKSLSVTGAKYILDLSGIRPIKP